MQTSFTLAPDDFIIFMPKIDNCTKSGMLFKYMLPMTVRRRMVHKHS